MPTGNITFKSRLYGGKYSDLGIVKSCGVLDKLLKGDDLMSQGSLSPKIRFLCQKVCSVAREQTDRRTDRHESKNREHPFRVSGLKKKSFNLSSRRGPMIDFDFKAISTIQTDRRTEKKEM